MNNYTDKILNDSSFYDLLAEFAKSCIIDYREDNNLPFPPPPKPLEYYIKYYVDMRDNENKKLNNFLELSDNIKQQYYEDYIDTENKYYTTRINNNNKIRDKYNDVINKLNEFNINNDEKYINFKTYMINTIASSLEVDCCNTILEDNLTYLNKLSYEEWYKNTIDTYNDNIRYANDMIDKETKAYKEKWDWIDGLVLLLEKYK